MLIDRSKGLLDHWKRLPRKYLIAQAKMWYYVVRTRLIPTTLNSTVVKNGALFTYVILKRTMIDVEKIINVDIHALVNLRTKTQFLGFLYLICTLCSQAGLCIIQSYLIKCPLNLF